MGNNKIPFLIQLSASSVLNFSSFILYYIFVSAITLTIHFYDTINIYHYIILSQGLELNLVSVISLSFVSILLFLGELFILIEVKRVH